MREVEVDTNPAHNLLCPLCGDSDAYTEMLEQEFEYRQSESTPPVTLTTKPIPVTICPTCDLCWTGEEGEEARTQAVLAYQRKDVPCAQ